MTVALNSVVDKLKAYIKWVEESPTPVTGKLKFTVDDANFVIDSLTLNHVDILKVGMIHEQREKIKILTACLKEYADKENWKPGGLAWTRNSGIAVKALKEAENT